MQAAPPCGAFPDACNALHACADGHVRGVTPASRAILGCLVTGVTLKNLAMTRESGRV